MRQLDVMGFINGPAVVFLTVDGVFAGEFARADTMREAVWLAQDAARRTDASFRPPTPVLIGEDDFT